MQARGLFFLRMHASTVSDTAGNRLGVRLPVVERVAEPGEDGRTRWVVINTLLAHWKGPDALTFFDAHQHELRAGRPLDLELDRLRGHDGEWHASVTACALAPLAPSWAGKEGASSSSDDQPTPQAQPA
jgi:hypothetical protein